ncbi:MAG: thiamine pyrophosphate-dependent enzyme [Halanaerobiales bacterium]
MSLQEIAQKEERLSSGHRLCAGCAAGTVARLVVNASDNPAVIGCATGCLEVSTTIYPYTSWEDSFIHNAFENAAATVSGVEAAYRALKRKGKVDEDYDFIAFGGDGGTYDIGFQSLSGAMERGHDMLYVCYDNGAYMNTGIQRSSATPKGASTTTSPAGKKIPGKQQYRKELTDIMAAHGIPYVAQAAPWRPQDLINKVKKALAVDGPTFINVLAPCPRGWRSETDMSIELSKIATQTCFWPLFEIEDGEWKLNYEPREKKPIEEWLKPQGRFQHLFKEENKDIIKEVQKHVDERWEKIKKLTK